jgi:hypothetical protein
MLGPIPEAARPARSHITIRRYTERGQSNPTPSRIQIIAMWFEHTRPGRYRPSSVCAGVKRIGRLRMCGLFCAFVFHCCAPRPAFVSKAPGWGCALPPRAASLLPVGIVGGSPWPCRPSHCSSASYVLLRSESVLCARSPQPCHLVLLGSNLAPVFPCASFVYSLLPNGRNGGQ